MLSLLKSYVFILVLAEGFSWNFSEAERFAVIGIINILGDTAFVNF